MDLLVDSPVPVIMTGMLGVLLFLNYSLPILKAKISKKKLPPQPKGAWPVLGHLPLLRGPLPLSVFLANMADKYGPIFMIKMGVRRSVIISSWELAKECFTANDKILASRPNSLKSEVLGYNGAMFGLSPYGEYWRQIRKIVTLGLLSNHRVQMLKHVRESEVQSGIEDIYQLWEMTGKDDDKGVIVKMKQWFANITLNLIVRVIAGRRYASSTISQEDGGGHSDPWRQAISDYFELEGTFVLSDAFPFLRSLDLGRYEKSMKKTAQKLDVVVQGWLDEHKRKRTSGSKVKGEEADFMDAMLSIIDEGEELSSLDADTINKATCLGLILGASGTTGPELTWALALLLSNQDILKKAQDELDTYVGKERKVQESDMKNLVYLQAILKETLRLGPATSLLPSHESIEDCNIYGYYIPKGTRLCVNFWKLHRDPRVWSDPCEFKPERFLTTHKHVDVRGQNFELLPFGSGRRMCPGASFALQIMEHTLASLLHGFDISVPFGKQIDLDVGFATQLEVILSPRLPSHLYKQ